METMINILIGLTLFLNGFVLGWHIDDLKYRVDKIPAYIVLSLFGGIILVFYLLGVLIENLCQWIKSL